MIIISMGAGLGNQMFEYAFYMHIKKIYPEQEVKVDVEYAFPKEHNGIEIFDIFGINAPEASLEEVLMLTKGYRLRGEGFNKSSFWRKVKQRLKIHPSTMRIQHDFTEYYPDFLNIKISKSVYFLGPFANYHYFKDIDKVILDTYIFPPIDDERNKEYKKKIENSNSISIHVRRGDYVTVGAQIVPQKFYYKAIEMIDSIIGNAQYFVFTDDIDYSRKLFGEGEKFVYIEGNNGKNSYRDMHLMSLCKHNITANSTFSFWGAFLNKNVKKIVIVPDISFSENGAIYPYSCDDWIML